MHLVKKASTRKNILKVGDVIDAETLDSRVPEVNGKDEVGHSIRTYLSNTRSTPDILY